MDVGITARLERISTGGRYLVVPMDHGITLGPVKGLVDLETTVDAITRGGADAVLTQKGVARRVHPKKNGKGYIVHLNGSTVIGPDSNDKRLTGSVEEALRVGADAVSFHMNVGSEFEPDQMTQLGELTEKAHRFGLPVLAMNYARGQDIDSQDAENLAHAVRLAEELGADVVKTSYTGEAETFERVCEATRLPVVIAGGSRGTDRQTIEMVRGAMDGGAAGVSMGRSIFQHDDPEAITRAVSAVIHRDADTETALHEAGLGLEA
ncbi:class I fructose-bisphosphate aldolase family protein [Halogeometricum borinquense]|uniref:2-amino-3,7-dideoxy-D-threo-hept-6-ulosonate synthase n=2 Tax=Halogeometricum borinquense TaxID=60847 RepID=E4NRE4_HALBP|nr:2-amino-3,7-dideoxy-D-threo-hept-6-ulosonate synthase [Halogeometricum borinquense]ADQ67985.1 2-amino-3,7-dideoxy-D-threo-hept-6-ulosonate synthase [Halogeometricum borinquense DSM 11551]ELY24094.1 fructose-bisphosphate aldolase [Halogeometricum borinquense DSM 11551]QIB73406.1 class I fructose-bisphosphate aldolase family protein [Halogeometricum borinquense]QIQ77193.1 class I fructose-bisphosphate aldolase family protein [Halogeometricum borinquense]RYJ13092.1 fructose-bisphosphate aldola